MSASEPHQHYVYLYRTKAGKPLYVGYGASVMRPAAHHGKHAHNDDLSEALNQHPGYTLEISGPFGDRQRALAVETALISAFRQEPTLCNVHNGHVDWRFRPMGVPNRFNQRVDQPPLDGADLKGLAVRAGGIILVKIGEQDLGDGRASGLLSRAPSDDQIAARVDRWWQLKGHAASEWRDAPGISPSLLIGVGGRASLQMVIASIRIDRHGWADAIASADANGLVRVPHDENNLGALDRYKVRGRRIDPEAGLKFGQFRQQSFIVYDNAGVVIKGGRRS